MGQQVRILPVEEKWRYPKKRYEESVAIIVEVARNDIYSYSICPKSKNDVNSGAWFPYSCMKLMLGGKVTNENLKKALHYFILE